MNYQFSLINFRETPDETLFLTYLVAEKVKTTDVSLKPLVATKLLTTYFRLWASAGGTE